MTPKNNTVNVKGQTTAVAKPDTKAAQAAKVKDLIQSRSGDIAKALPSVITPERFTRMAMTAIAGNDKLLMSTAPSIIGALFVAAQLGLEPNTPLGQAYIVPYKNNDTGQMEATFQLGYRGIIDLGYRSGEMKMIQAHIVYSNDVFEYELGMEPKLVHRPALGDRGTKAAVYAVYHLKSGGYGFEVMSVKEVNEHRNQFSKAKNSPAWTNSWDEMAKKTVIKKALKYAPMKSDFIRATVMDEQRLILNETNVGSERILDVTPDYEIIETKEPAPKGTDPEREPEPVDAEQMPDDDDIMAGAPAFLKD